MREQINWQVSFNLRNRSHVQLMDWIEDQTTNKSSFIRETLLMRMMGMVGFKSVEVKESSFEDSRFDEDEVLRLIQV